MFKELNNFINNRPILKTPKLIRCNKFGFRIETKSKDISIIRYLFITKLKFSKEKRYITKKIKLIPSPKFLSFENDAFFFIIY
tara:strand:+ start:105 stop:353 length:249 start_codon:yes stop_codon:yes gene_type:complete